MEGNTLPYGENNYRGTWMLSIKVLLNYVDYGSVLLAQRNWPMKQEKKNSETQAQAVTW